jgi:hypothetical protein
VTITPLDQPASNDDSSWRRATDQGGAKIRPPIGLFAAVPGTSVVHQKGAGTRLAGFGRFAYNPAPFGSDKDGPFTSAVS